MGRRSADDGAGSPLLASRLQDFGFRGCTCVEQSVLGGAAHLLSFDGTDTMSAAYYVQVPTPPGGWGPARRGAGRVCLPGRKALLHLDGSAIMPSQHHAGWHKGQGRGVRLRCAQRGGKRKRHLCCSFAAGLPRPNLTVQADLPACP